MVNLLKKTKNTLLFEGWRQYLVAVFSGALLVFCFSPFGQLFPFIFIFSILVYMVLNAKTKFKAFLIGWFFGFGFFVASLYWVSYSLLTDPDKYLWLVPLAVIILPMIMSFYPAFACLVFRWINIKSPISILIFAAIWVVFEYLRAHLLSGFPWVLIGYSLNSFEELMQLASLFGIFGQSFVAIIIGACPYIIVVKYKSDFIKLLSFLLLFYIYTFIFIFGDTRINSSSDKKQSFVSLRLVQGNISQDIKWLEEKKYENLMKYIELSKSKLIDGIDYIIWPEAAIPFKIPNKKLLNLLGSVAPKGGALITGALRTNMDYSNYKYWNSIIIVNHQGQLISYYDKMHLVPFGEYVPLRFLFGLFSDVANNFADVEEGKVADWIKVRNNEVNFVPLVCYETIFPSHPVFKNKKHDWILNLTNDGWFGDSIGPYQHFEMARLRAVEQGKILVRVANTGITGVFNKFGKVINKIPLSEEGIIDIKINQSDSIITMYGRLGDELVLLVIILCGALCCGIPWGYRKDR